MEPVITLPEAADNQLVGGKAKALYRLIKAGFKVPDGFVVTTNFDTKDIQKVLQQFDKLGAKKVAVRSSAVAEDGAKDAWAGQLDTFLNVGRGELIEKVLACFESTNSARAKAYAKQKNISAGKVAVIIQQMVPADVTGVAFSVHPVTGDRQQMVFESVLGLGDKLVSGTVTPDTYVVGRDGRIIQQHLVTSRPNLTPADLEMLTKAIIKIEKHFGFPVDVEWILSKKQLYILQSRPVTTVG